MRILALCPPEFHDVAAAEARKLVGAKAEKSPLGIAFSCNETDVARYTYAARIPRRTLALLGTFAAAEELEKTLSSVSALLKDFEIADWCDARTFSVVCEREGRHAYSSQDVVSGLADLLKKNTQAAFTYKNADISLFVVIDGKSAALGVDLCGFAADKRDYRLFAAPSDVKGTVAAALLGIAGYDGSQPLHNFFCTSGTVAIEAALIAANKSPHSYRKNDFALLRFKPFLKSPLRDSERASSAPIYALDPAMRNVRFAEKNAKIAGVNKLISFSRIDTEMLESKFEDSSVTLALASPPSPSKNLAEKAVRVQLETFFSQLAYLLAPGGRLVTLSRKQEPLLTIASESGLLLEARQQLAQGDLTLFISTFKKAASLS